MCSACGVDALIVRTPMYDGFTPVGEQCACAACGHVYLDEDDIPYKDKPKIAVFSDADRIDSVELFEVGEAESLCRFCENYVVNPFMQWCSHHKKEVEATDTCESFSARPPVEQEPESSEEGR